MIEWVKEGQRLGAGEILLTSMDADGTQQGYDLEMLQAVQKVARVPLIASGGCGSLDDLKMYSLQMRQTRHWRLRCFIMESLQSRKSRMLWLKRESL